jgi:hypothetical protein
MGGGPQFPTSEEGGFRNTGQEHVPRIDLGFQSSGAAFRDPPRFRSRGLLGRGESGGDCRGEDEQDNGKQKRS